MKIGKIKRKKLHINELKEDFCNSKSLSINDLYSFYKSIDTNIPRSTVRWRVHELIELGILIRIGRGIYQFGNRVLYSPSLTSKIKSIYKKTKAQFPFADFCIWDTRFLNEFMIHQPASFITIIETENDVMGSLFNFLKESNRNVFLNPEKNIIENYISGEKDSIIVKPLISEAPTKLIDNIETIILEKMLVDIYSDARFFYYFHGTEMDNIYSNAIGTYTINQSKLLRYASRRGKRKEVEMLLNKNQTNGNT